MNKNIEYNKIMILYKHGKMFGKDKISINIINTSTGALRMFKKDINNLSKKYTQKDYNNIIISAYHNLLIKLYDELEIKLTS